MTYKIRRFVICCIIFGHPYVFGMFLKFFTNSFYSIFIVHTNQLSFEHHLQPYEGPVISLIFTVMPFILTFCIAAESFRQNENILVWCTSNKEEQHKCGNFSAAVDADHNLFNSYDLRIACHQVLGPFLSRFHLCIYSKVQLFFFRLQTKTNVWI